MFNKTVELENSGFILNIVPTREHFFLPIIEVSGNFLSRVDDVTKTLGYLSMDVEFVGINGLDIYGEYHPYKTLASEEDFIRVYRDRLMSCAENSRVSLHFT